MHHALHIQEILLNIFGYCSPTASHWERDRRRSTAVLAALARTCRTFKEPALDVLWSEMIDLTPLPQCIPDACRVRGRRYSFKRRPNDAEWDVLRSYTRRIWHIFGYANPDGWLDNDSLIAICSNPPVTDPLFQNLRTLYWQGITMIPAVHIAVPSLTSLRLSITLGHVPALNDFLDTIGALCSNIKQYQISIPRPHLLDEIICSHVRRQTNLQVLYCSGLTLDANTILYLSELSTFVSLSILSIPDAPIWTLSSGSAFVFSSLTYLKMGSKSLEMITGLLSCIQLPVVENLSTSFSAYPSKETLGSYMTTLSNVCSSNFLAKIEIRRFEQPRRTFGGANSEPDHRLTLDDVRPFMTFVNLRHVHVNLEWSVDLTDSDLLALVSAWPRVHTLLINDEWGWRTTGGITLLGLSQLLQKCPSLSTLCVAIRTESFTYPPHGFETEFHLPLRPLTIDLADSPIEPADVPALVDVFAKLGFFSNISAWCGRNMGDTESAVDCRRAWDQVFARVRGGP